MTQPEKITFKKPSVRTIKWRNKIIKTQSLTQEPVIVCIYGFFMIL